MILRLRQEKNFLLISIFRQARTNNADKNNNYKKVKNILFRKRLNHRKKDSP